MLIWTARNNSNISCMFSSLFVWVDYEGFPKAFRNGGLGVIVAPILMCDPDYSSILPSIIMGSSFVRIALLCWYFRPLINV